MAEWSESATIVAVRAHGESSAIVEVLSALHGRHAGLVRGARSKAMRGVLQPGTDVRATWRARLEEHLGTFSLELERSRAAVLMEDAAALAGLNAACALLPVLPEREAHPRLYDAFKVLLDSLEDEAVWPAVFVRFELGLLQEMGFGLDLSRCAATGAADDLVYVSPRTGRAVSGEAGEPYRARLFRLPPFLLGSQAGAGAKDIAQGFVITGHFLERRLFAPAGKPLPRARADMIARLGMADARQGA